jgi:acyl carrier protein
LWLADYVEMAGRRQFDRRGVGAGDELDAVELIIACEEAFGIEIPDKEGNQFKRVRE